MSNYIQEEVSNVKNFANLMIGLLIGGLAGATAMLLFVPQSGKATRKQIQEKAYELRDRTNATVEDAKSQILTSFDQIKTDLTEKAKEMKHQGEDVLVDQLGRVSSAAELGRRDIKSQRA